MSRPPGAARGPAQTLQQAVTRHQQGDLATAESLYREVLRGQPDDATALNLLGVLKTQSGAAREAVALIGRAVAAHPGYAEAHNNLGLALRNAGQLAEAVQAHERALALRPAYPEALNNLATALREQGRHAEALAACDRALALRPEFAQALNNRGATLQHIGRHAEALAAIDAALALAPQLATAHFNRGVVLGDIGRHEDAVASYRRSVEFNPMNAQGWNNLGFALQSVHRDEEALPCFAQALKLAPDHVEARINQGNSLHELRRLPAAIDAFEQALRKAPQHVGAWTNKGIALADAGRWPEAQQAFERVCALEPGHRHALGNRFNAAIRNADWTHFEAWRAEVEDAVMAGEPAATPFVFLAASDSAEAQRRCASLYAQQTMQRVTPLAALPSPLPWTHEKTRIGYLSADLHDHATAQLLVEVMERHDRGRFEISAWSFGPLTGDAMQKRLRAAYDQFHDVRQQPDAETARRIRAHEIDILVDLKGYTQDSRPEILAMRPAPVQVNFLGYPGTMGTPAIDFILADAQVIPPAHEAFYAEKVVRLPHSYQPNCLQRDMAEAVPGRAALGLPDDGFVFCCFNHAYKITPVVFAVWMRLLAQVPHSVLWLLQDSPAAAQHLRAAAQAQGVAPERIVFAPRAPLPEHLARHAAADLFLDTAPVNAHTTASDALWAGLPVLTCMGHSFVSRVAGSLVAAAGVPELATHSLEDYEATALRLATHPAELDELKRRLREGRATAPLFDSTAYARALEAAYMRMVETA